MMLPGKCREKWIATASIMLFSVAAHAQSSVTLYGQLDTGILYTSKTLNSATGQNGGAQFSLVNGGIAPSIFGLTGTEDLGGGLYADFKLESGIDVANGGYQDSNGNLFGRQAWVGLRGNFGQVRAGLQFSPFFLAILDADPTHFSFFGSSIVNYIDNVYATGAFSAGAVTYTSPKMAGFTGSVMFAPGGEAGDFQAGRRYSASLKYEGAGVMINAAIYDGNSGGVWQTPTPSTLAFEGRMLGAAYTLGTVTLKASFTNYKVAGSFNNNVYSGGFDYYVSPRIDIDGNASFTSDRDQTTNHSWLAALGARYFLSARTLIYGEVGAVRNNGAMDTGIALNAALFEVKNATTVGTEIGIKHSF
jgi:predicted porin